LAVLAQLRHQHPALCAAGTVGQGQALAAQPAVVGRMRGVTFDCHDASAGSVVLAVHPHAATHAAVAAGGQRGAPAAGGGAGCAAVAIHQAGTSAAGAVSSTAPAAASASHTWPSRSCTG